MSLRQRYLRLCNRRGQDGWSILFGYPVGRLALLWLERFTALSPTHLTVLSIGVRAAGAGLLVRREIGWAILLLQLGQVLDSMDGTLARARGQHSASGAFLDKTGDAIALGLVCAAVGWNAGSAGWMAAEADLYLWISICALVGRWQLASALLLASQGIAALALMIHGYQRSVIGGQPSATRPAPDRLEG